MRHFMIIRGWLRFAGWPAAAGFALCLSAGAVQSQDSPQISPPPPAKTPQTSQPATAPPTATTTAPTQVPVAPKLPVLIVDMRPEADIQSDRDAARALKPKAQADEQRAGGDVIQSKATLEIKKKELDALKTRLDLAKKGGNESELATLDRQRQEEELGIKLLERLVAVRECQVELARARRKLADASMLALESELEMGKKRTRWDSLTQPWVPGASAQDIVSLQVDIRSDELRVLQAMKDRSETAEEVAKKDSQLIERQIGVLEADTAIQQFTTRAH
jgi:hypothetical protein